MKDSIRILIVDDDATYRYFITKVIDGMSDVDVVADAANGRIALAKLRQVAVDMVLLDMKMPIMNGLETLKHIRQQYPDIAVILLSSKQNDDVDDVVQALEMGAMEFVSKTEMAETESSILYFRSRLSTLVGLYRARRNSHLSMQEPKEQTPAENISPTLHEPVVAKNAGDARSAAWQQSRIIQYPPMRIRVVVIGASTGGPNALAKTITRLPGDLGVPVLLVQHIPDYYTTSLAASLCMKSNLDVRVATKGEEVRPNVVYLAPGGKHMVVRQKTEPPPLTKRIVIDLNNDPPENSVCPSADVLFRSVSKVYGGNILAIIMTGMGSDGAKGVDEMKKVGCYCLSQSEDSCVVYGMPRAVDEASLSDEKVPLEQLAQRIISITKGRE